jgi:hypothetical protein
MPDAASSASSAESMFHPAGPPWTELRDFLASPHREKRFPGFADVAQAETWAR